MTYSPPEDIFSVLSDPTPNTSSVTVKYNNKDIGAIAGPQPLVSLSNNFVRTSVGDLENITTTISLNGKIALFNPGFNEQYPTGLKNLIQDRIIALKQLFESCPISIFEISIGNDQIFSATGVKVKSFNVDKSDNNWMFSADYTAELEYSTIPDYNKDNPNAFLVTNTADTWSVEPIEDYVWNSYYFNNLTADTEYHNPKILPPLQSGAINIGGNNNSTNLNVVNIPQFRITHKLSAVGIPGSGNNTNSYCQSGLANSAYLNAQKWVHNRAQVPFNHSAHNNSNDIYEKYPFLTDTAAISAFSDNLFLYNHLRTTNFSISDGSYELNDTWLAMPSGMKFIEDYTVESSTDDRNIKTVRVQGTIKGLSLSSFSVMTSGTVINSENNIGHINLKDFAENPNQQGLLTGADYVYDSKQQGTAGNFATSKYDNALRGWLNDVKPYLYHRASTVINSSDRNRNYVNSTSFAGSSSQTNEPPGNPIYSYEKALRINPIGSTEGHDIKKGIISYSYEYNNKGLNLISGVLSESISINDTGPADVISETVVIGRALGPVIQSLGTQTATKRDVAIEVTVSPPTGIKGVIMTQSECPVYIHGTVYTSIVSLIEGLKPFGGRSGNIFGNISRNTQTGYAYVASDTHSWDATNGRYSRNVSWVYQHCQNNYSDYLEQT
jgi:hypothetical protein